MIQGTYTAATGSTIRPMAREVTIMRTPEPFMRATGSTISRKVSGMRGGATALSIKETLRQG